MDGCPVCFNATSRLQLNPEFVSGTWENSLGKVIVRLLFDAVMDTSVLPDVTNLALTLNSLVRGIDTVAWDSSTALRLVSDAGIPAVAPVTIELEVEDQNLHQLAGKNVLPFGPETLPEL